MSTGDALAEAGVQLRATAPPIMPVSVFRSSALHAAAHPPAPSTAAVRAVSPPTHAAAHTLWIDLELTGLDTRSDHIIEVGALVVRPDLSVADSFHFVVKPPDAAEVFRNMGSWCKRTHNKPRADGRSLVGQCLESPYDVHDADVRLAAPLDLYRGGRQVILGGSTVYVDAQFIREHMPITYERLHHHTMDVTSVLVFARAFYPGIDTMLPPRTPNLHSAMDDIWSSLQLAQWFRANVFPAQLPGSHALFGPPGIPGPGVAPGLAAPGLAAPGLAAPGLAAPGLVAPGLAAPGLAAPGLAGPFAPEGVGGGGAHASPLWTPPFAFAVPPVEDSGARVRIPYP